MKIPRFSSIVGTIALCMTIASPGCDDSTSDLPELPSPETAEIPEPDTPLHSDVRRANLPQEGPHGGASIPITDEHGYVEWIAETGYVYLLDAASDPLRKVANPRVILNTSNGPRETQLVPCSTAAPGDTCFVCPCDTLRGQAHAVRLLRFELNGQGHHVRIPRLSSATQPEA